MRKDDANGIGGCTRERMKYNREEYSCVELFRRIWIGNV